MNQIYDTLNPMQREAVFTTDGPLLILAGAGSGKTRALTHRIAYLIEEKGVRPWNILAITFTNKAAGEMRERVDSLVEYDAASIWVSTFHSLCVRILRRNAGDLGFDPGFTIYDTDDQKVLIRQVMKKLEMDPKMYRERSILSVISAQKNELVTPEAYYAQVSGDFRAMRMAEAYTEYQNELQKNNAFDFDDLIMKTVELLRNHSDLREHYQERFRYIMVDEYQDTNTAQFALISLLAGKYKNLCVVGDDDQSIYRFRGANIGNILNFEQIYPEAHVIKLEQNYRSTKSILDVANEVIRNNEGRKEKKLWTANEEGAPVRYAQYDTGYDEAGAIVREIQKARDEGMALHDCAVLYRTNAQSRLLEEKCIQYNVPYRLIGGVNFYQRKEIKDILAYLKTINGGRDDLSVQRIINVPKRGIGASSIGKVMLYATANDLSFFEAASRAERIPGIGRAGLRLESFVKQINAYRAKLEYRTSIEELIRDILETSGYDQELEKDSEEEAEARRENLEELISKAADYEATAAEPSLDGFLEEVALVAEVDNLDPSEDRVTLMTLHGAKGLEFTKVYMAGMEEGLFPGSMAADSDNPEDLEEERRLFYVGVTRAKKELTLTCARLRMVNGENRYNRRSRFIDEIPAELLADRRAVRAPERRERENSVPAGGGSVRRGSPSYKAPAAGGFGRLTESDIRMGRQFVVTKEETLPYGTGDRVVHMKFGKGTVVEITEQKRDFEVAVDFDGYGIKRMYASFAKLTKA
ncbi:MAG: UvrD-helicase domain-containing protein [Lachnospiraceae bacterium]|jgi:DNA helicase-2/ATP-dependent DNA helicase PcrA|nr:UvrD-helicase domain-containing protein [Lachnospiraceae bacterium]